MSMTGISREFSFPSKLFVIIGSGASAGLGYPTMDELTAEAALERLPEKNISIRLLEFASNIDLFLRTHRGFFGIESAIERANSYVEALGDMGIDQNFIEYLLERTIQRSSAGVMLETAAAVRELLYESIHYIYSSRAVTSPEHILAAQNLTDLYKYLADINCGYLDIFTTNYDMALQSIFEQAQYSINLVDKSFSFYQNAEKSYIKHSTIPAITIAVHRLHGCVEFCWTEKGKLTSWKSGTKIWSNMAVKISNMDRELDREPFKSAYAEFRKKLGQFGTICIALGVGFRDRDLAHSIYEALVSENGCKALIVLDKYLSKDEICERLTKFPGVDKKLLGDKCVQVLNNALEVADSKILIQKALSSFQGTY